MKILVAISGASGVNIGLKLAYEISKRADAHIIISEGAKLVLMRENGVKFLTNSLQTNSQDNQNDGKNEISAILDELEKKSKIYSNSDLAAAVSSGSFGIDATIIAPCSINTLAKINAGFADTLITRVAAVALKQRKKLILGVREMPFSSISLEHMSRLSLYGAIIAPPIFGYYSDIKSLYDMENFIIGKWLDLLGLENEIYKKWG